MATPNDIQLYRYEDGTPSVMRRKDHYMDLFFFRKSNVLVQLTKVFCDRFLPKYGDRTVDQMVQAARSIKQNIAEGLTDGQTSFEVEIKLLGIAKGSNQELLEDYQDYLQYHRLSDWAKHKTSPTSLSSLTSLTSPTSTASPSRTANPATRYDKMVAFCRTHNDDADYRPFYYQWTDEEMANTAICLCHIVDKAMTTYIAQCDREFVAEGGIRERMTAARLDMRGTQKQINAQQQEQINLLLRENAALKERIAQLEQQSLK